MNPKGGCYEDMAFRIGASRGVGCCVPRFCGVPLDTVKENVTSVLDVLRDPKLRGEAGRKAKEEKIEAAADTLFDFVELSKRTLGLSWNKFTVDQRKEFVRLFETLLRGIYVDRITAYTDEQVNFTKEVPLSETTAEVESTVKGKSGRVEIDYRVMKGESRLESVRCGDRRRQPHQQLPDPIPGDSCEQPAGEAP